MEKLKAGIFDGSQIREFMKDPMFDEALNEAELTAEQLLMLHSHIIHIHLHTCMHICRCMQNHNDDTIKTSTQSFRKIYLSLYLKGLRVRGSWRPNRTVTYWPPLLWPSALCLPRSPGLLNRRPGGPALCWVLAFSTTSCHQRVWSPN